MKEYKFDGFLYVTTEGVNNVDALQMDIEKVLNNKFASLEVEYQENREDVQELATSFNVIVDAESEEQAESLVLSVLEGYDVDNYYINEI